MYGYTGKIAIVDLSSGSVGDYPFSDQDREKYLGGKTLAAKIIYDAFDQEVEPLSQENIVVISTSPLTGSTAPCSSRFNISTFSPLTGLLVTSNCGGNFGLHLKRAGYDALIIKGKSREKVYLDISEEEIQIKNADKIWGKKTGETQELIGGKNRGALVIGPAGENLVRYAAVISEERAAGRGGVGAVLGYKNLKGLVAGGKKSIEFYDKERFKKHNQAWIKLLMEHPMTGDRLPKLGTANFVRKMNQSNLLATRNFSRGSYQDHEKISGETLREKYLLKNKGCATCPIQCGRVVELDGKAIKGPELETIGLLGSNLLSNDLGKIIRVNHLCDEFGIDTMTFGSSVGLAMELNERGLWSNGLEFGQADKLEELVEQTAYRQGIGEDLAEGTKRISEKFGGTEFAMHVKGLEVAAYEPRAAQGMGLGYATSNRGGCHLNGGYLVALEGLGLEVSGKTTMGKAAFTIFFQDLMEAVSSGGTCLFTTLAVLPAPIVKKPNGIAARITNKVIPSIGGIVRLLHNQSWLMALNLKSVLPFPYAIRQVTGFKLNIGKFIQIGERGYNLERMINIRQGLKPGSDALPKRLINELQREDDRHSMVRLDAMLNKYYKIRGWDENGVPKQSRLKKLGLV